MLKGLRRFQGQGLFYFAIVAVGVATAFFVFRFRDSHLKMPYLEQWDLDDDRRVAFVHQVRGEARLRTARPRDLGDFSQVTPKNELEKEGFVTLAKGDSVYLGSILRLIDEGSFLSVATIGHWQILLDGDGEAILEEARTNEGRSVHTQRWILKKGTFRAKSSLARQGDYWLELVTPKGNILAHQGEFGARVGADQKVQVWNISGQLRLFAKDGKVFRLPPKEMRGLE